MGKQLFRAAQIERAEADLLPPYWRRGEKRVLPLRFIFAALLAVRPVGTAVPCVGGCSPLVRSIWGGAWREPEEGRGEAAAFFLVRFPQRPGGEDPSVA